LQEKERLRSLSFSLDGIRSLQSKQVGHDQESDGDDHHIADQVDLASKSRKTDPNRMFTSFLPEILPLFPTSSPANKKAPFPTGGKQSFFRELDSSSPLFEG
jgi:hypothetical protein